MRLAQLNNERNAIHKIYEPAECGLYGWTPENMPEFSPEIVLIDITELSPDIREGWSYTDGEFSAPPPPPPPTLAEGRAAKIAEIRERALRVGEIGLDINTGTKTYHLACTPEDVALLQQANMVAKMSWEAAGLPAGDVNRTAEIKEKWIDGRTLLHTDVPEAQHDAVLFQAALYARSILLRQEELMQQVQDAADVEAVQAVSWAESALP